MRNFIVPIFGASILLASFAIGAQVCDDGLACFYESSGPRGLLSFDIGSDVPVLTGFQLGYDGGDQHIRTIAVGSLPDRPGQFQLRLNDNDRAESIHGWARYIRYEAVMRSERARLGLPESSPIYRMRTASRSGCRGSCAVSLPGYDRSLHTPLFTGFRFSFEDTDHHLRSLGINFSRDGIGSGEVWTMFRDNSQTSPYSVVLSYVLVPHGVAFDERLYGGVVSPLDERTRQVHVAAPSNESGRVLCGFQLGFDPNDQHVQSIGVVVGRNGATFTLRDNDAKESINPYLHACRLAVE